MPDLAQILGGNAPLPGANSAVSTLQDLIAKLRQQQAAATFPEAHSIQSGGSPAGGGGNDLGKLLSGLGGKSGGGRAQPTGGGIGSMFQSLFGSDGSAGFDTGGMGSTSGQDSSMGWYDGGTDSGVTNFGMDTMPDTGWWT